MRPSPAPAMTSSPQQASRAGRELSRVRSRRNTGTPPVQHRFRADGRSEPRSSCRRLCTVDSTPRKPSLLVVHQAKPRVASIGSAKKSLAPVARVLVALECPHHLVTTVPRRRRRPGTTHRPQLAFRPSRCGAGLGDVFTVPALRGRGPEVAVRARGSHPGTATHPGGTDPRLERRVAVDQVIEFRTTGTPADSNAQGRTTPRLARSAPWKSRAGPPLIRPQRRSLTVTGQQRTDVAGLLSSSHSLYARSTARVSCHWAAGKNRVEIRMSSAAVAGAQPVPHASISRLPRLVERSASASGARSGFGGTAAAAPATRGP